MSKKCFNSIVKAHADRSNFQNLKKLIQIITLSLRCFKSLRQQELIIKTQGYYQNRSVPIQHINLYSFMN